jgi:hypothetical protein
MKAQSVIIGIRKNAVEDYEGYFYYKEKATTSIKGQKKITKNGKHLIELYFEGKEPEMQTITKDDGTTYEIEKPDIILFLNQTEKGSISLGGDLITDFGLYFPIQGWLDKERMSVRLEANYDYISENFIKAYGNPVFSIADIDFSDEDLAQSERLFPDAAAFFKKYVISKRDARFSEKLNKTAPRIMPSSTKKAPVTQGQLDLAKDNVKKARATGTATETEEIPF